jgi:hypothetical protein
MLGGIYSGFTEGLDTLDLRDAKALLDGLRRNQVCAIHQQGH